MHFVLVHSNQAKNKIDEIFTSIHIFGVNEIFAAPTALLLYIISLFLLCVRVEREISRRLQYASVIAVCVVCTFFIVPIVRDDGTLKF